MPTIRDVADKAGVSPSTVSFVLNGRSNVAPETQLLVAQAMKDLGYNARKAGRPRNSERRTPSTRRKNQISFVVAQAAANFQTNLIYLAVMQGIEQTICNSGQNLVLQYVTDSTPVSPETLTAKLDGSIIIPGAQDAIFRQIASRIPVVRVMGLPGADSPWDHVTYNNLSVGRIAARYLLSRGHRHCGYFAPTAGMSSHSADIEVTRETFRLLTQQRHDSFASALAESGATTSVNTTGYNWPDADPETTIRIVQEILSHQPRITALFVPADGLTVRVYAALHYLGIRPGRDIEIVSCNNEQPLLNSLHPSPAIIDIHAPLIGRRAVELLFARLENRSLPPSLMLIEPTLISPELPNI